MTMIMILMMMIMIVIMMIVIIMIVIMIIVTKIRSPALSVSNPFGVNGEKRKVSLGLSMNSAW